jgi:hypothetical protein
MYSIEMSIVSSNTVRIEQVGDGAAATDQEMNVGGKLWIRTETAISRSGKSAQASNTVESVEGR